MAKVSTFIYCDGFVVENTNQGSRLVLYSPIHIIKMQYMPTNHSFGVVFGLLGVDFKSDLKLTYLFKDPNGNEVLKNEAPLSKVESIKHDPSLPDSMQGFFINFDLRNITLKLEGEYISEVYLDDEKLGGYPIFIKKV